MKRRLIPKPWSEKTKAEKIAEANAAIARLSHAHNRYDPTCMQAVQRWRETLKELER